MINKVISGVVAALDEAFGEIPVYTENVEQGLEEPSFSVRCVNPTEKQVLGKRYFRKNPVTVTYFPSPSGGNREINAVFEKLFSILEYIKIDGDLQRGTHMETHTEDGVGLFMVDYDFFVLKTEELNPMEELEMRESVYEKNQ